MSKAQAHPEVVEAIETARALPRGHSQVAALRDAVAVAQRVGGFDNELLARIELTEALYHVPSHESDLAHFAWLRTALDNGEQVGSDDRWRILWMLKWALVRIEDTPSVPLATVWRAIDDYEACLVAAGWQLRPVHAARARLSRETDDRAGVTRNLQLWRATPRDGMSDCEACELRGQGRLLADSDPAAARELIRPVTDGHVTCGEEPAACLADSVRYSLDLGDIEGAIAAHRAGWRLCEGRDTLASSVATHLVALVRLGNADRAVEYLLPRLSWLDTVHSAVTRIRFLGAAALVLRVGARAGLVAETVAGETPIERAARFEAEARDLARRLDERNGTTRHEDALTDALDERVVVESPALPALRVAAAGPARPEWATSIEAIATRLETQLEAYDPQSVLTSLSWLDERPRLLARAAPDDDRHLALLDRIASRSRPTDEARGLLNSSLAAAQRAGDHVVAARAEIDLALMLDPASPADEAGPAPTQPSYLKARARELADSIAVLGQADRAAHAWSYIGSRLRDPAERLAAFDRALELFAEGDDTVGAMLARVERALLLVQAGDTAGLAELDAIGDEPAAASTTVAVALAEAKGLCAWSQNEIDVAVAHLHRAVQIAGTATGSALRSKAMLCDLHVQRDDWQALEPVARALLAEAVTLRSADLLAVAQRHVGLVCVETGRVIEGAELLEAALPVIRRNDPPLLGPLGWALGRALDALEDSAGARTAFATSALAFEAAERYVEAGHAHLRAGNAICGVDNEAAGAHLDAAVEHAARAGDVMLLGSAIRDRAQLRGAEGDTESAVTELDSLVERLRALPGAGEVDEGYFTWLTQGVRRQAAHLVQRDGRADEAIERMLLAEQVAKDDTSYVALCRMERGAMLAEAGLLHESEILIRGSLPALDVEQHAQVRARCVGTLAQALHDSGRVEDANRVWDELVVGASS